MNREQHRRLKRQSKLRGVTYAEQLAQKKFLQDAAQKAVNDTTVQVKADMHVQRAMWLMCVAMNDAFGIGPKRSQRFLEAYSARADWLKKLTAEGDEEYAYEKLRKEASRVFGQEIHYLYENEMRQARERAEAEK